MWTPAWRPSGQAVARVSSRCGVGLCSCSRKSEGTLVAPAVSVAQVACDPRALHRCFAALGCVAKAHFLHETNVIADKAAKEHVSCAMRMPLYVPLHLFSGMHVPRRHTPILCLPCSCSCTPWTACALCPYPQLLCALCLHPPTCMPCFNTGQRGE